MNIWKTVGKIAVGFAVVFVVFAVFQAVIAYNGMNLNPGYYSAEAIQLGVISSMLPYLSYGALSIIAAVFSLRAGKESTEERKSLAAQSTEARLPETEPTETQA
jgi:hypothetical protein